MTMLMVELKTSAGDVIDHMVREGDHVTFTCAKSEGATIVWDNNNAGIIAIGGDLQGNIGHKFSISVDGNTEELGLLDIVLDDDGIYRCYTLFQSDYDRYNVTVLGMMKIWFKYITSLSYKFKITIAPWVKSLKCSVRLPVVMLRCSL